MSKVISLRRFLRIGDRVVMTMDKEAREWGRPGVPTGTAGTVIGFTRYDSYVSRIGSPGKRPGRYSCNGSGVIAWDNGEFGQPSASDLRWETSHARLAIQRAADQVWNAAFDTDQFVEPLPELEFWEHDIVRDKTGRIRMSLREDTLLRISHINYNNVNAKRDDGSPMPIYNVESSQGLSGTTSVNTDDLELVERGNVWKWFNDKSKIVWTSLREEANFSKLLGLTVEVPNPVTGWYTWSVEEVLPSLEAGLIDATSVCPGFFGSGSILRCHRFSDRELGERVRAECIQGFSN